MKKEDIEFLRELQHELNTQEHDEQAAPRFWGIEEKYLETAPEGDGEPYIFTCDYEKQTLEEYIESVREELSELTPEENENYDNIIAEWTDIDKENVDEVVEFVNSNLRKFGTEDDILWLKECTRVSEETGCFLTKRAAKKYLEKNYYHHNDGHTYAMTAWRNPEFERLMNILQTMNIDDIKED